MPKLEKRALVKILVFLLALMPLAILVFDGVSDRLGANPIEAITHRSGQWTLRFLLLTLSVSPLHRLLPVLGLMRLRRMLGLYAFFYASLHFLTYLVLDQFFEWDEIVKDVLKRPYITVGFTAFVMLIPLALTSTRAMVKRLGRHWKTLHRLVYVIATCGVIHFIWLVKADFLEPAIYAIILTFLLGTRLVTIHPLVRR